MPNPEIQDRFPPHHGTTTTGDVIAKGKDRCYAIRLRNNEALAREWVAASSSPGLPMWTELIVARWTGSREMAQSIRASLNGRGFQTQLVTVDRGLHEEVGRLGARVQALLTERANQDATISLQRERLEGLRASNDRQRVAIEELGRLFGAERPTIEGLLEAATACKRMRDEGAEAIENIRKAINFTIGTPSVVAEAVKVRLEWHELEQRYAAPTLETKKARVLKKER
jgi:hypothetical protein